MIRNMSRLFTAALALTLLLGAAVVAEGTMQAGPLALEAGVDSGSLLKTSATLHYGEEALTPITLRIAAEKAGGGVGTLRELVASAQEGTRVDALRYEATRGENGALRLVVEIDCTAGGQAYQFTDTLTLTPAADGATLAVACEQGGTPLHGNG